MLDDDPDMLDEFRPRPVGDDRRMLIEQTTQLLMKHSVDGREAVQLYWVDHIDPAHPEMPAIGKHILAD